MLKITLYIVVYMIPAALVWGAISIIVSRFLGVVPVLMLLLAWIYALSFGLIETLGLPLQSPSLAWQVPAHWLEKRSPAEQAILWGALLGPGLVTRNPYAGIWLLFLLPALNHGLLTIALVGIGIGMAHGTARALGILWNRKQVNRMCTYASIIGAQLRWKYINGIALLIGAGMFMTSVLWLLHISV